MYGKMHQSGFIKTLLEMSINYLTACLFQSQSILLSLTSSVWSTKCFTWLSTWSLRLNTKRAVGQQLRQVNLCRMLSKMLLFFFFKLFPSCSRSSEWPTDFSLVEAHGDFSSCGAWALGSKSEIKVLDLQWYLILCNPMDCSPSGSSVHGIFQARILEWVAISFSRRSSWLRDRTRLSHIAARFVTVWATREAQAWGLSALILFAELKDHFLREAIKLPWPGQTPLSSGPYNTACQTSFLWHLS